jgi:drug/metabolite transporter (DMT)-like permease
MPSNPGFPYRLVLGLALTIVIDTFVQLLWKTAALSLPETPSLEVIDAVIGQPLFIVVIALMFCQLFNWLSVLGEADLSFAQPFTSLSRISVALASAYFLHERLAPVQLIGIAMVCVGAWCVSRTVRNTPQAGKASP